MGKFFANHGGQACHVPCSLMRTQRLAWRGAIVRWASMLIMTRDHGLLRTSDAIILDGATRMGRVVFTHDYRDYTRLARERFSQQRPHGGILLAEVGDVGYHVRRLAIWLREMEHADLSYYCDWLPKYPGRL